MTIIQAQPLKTYGIFGPASSTDNEVPVFDGTSGKKIKAGSGLINPSAGRLDLAEVRAKNGNGLKLYDDGGSGIFIADGGNVTIGKDLTVTGVNSIIEDGTATGQMSFWNGTKWVKTETSELFWDDVNKRLGVGTASPSSNLHIKQSVDTATGGAGIVIENTGGTSGKMIMTTFNALQYSGMSFVTYNSNLKIGDNKRFYMGHNPDYYFEYISGSTRFDFTSLDIDGSGTNGVIFSVEDGTDDITFNGKVGIGTATPATSAKLEISSTTGALLLPRMTTVQRDALTAVNGMILYDTTLNQTQTYENGAWRQI